jgi:hypothetical protein
MAIIASTDNNKKERKDYYQSCFLNDTLSALRPRTDSETVIRPLPQFDNNGNLMPMVKTMTAAGPDFSNFTVEEVIINTGNSVKFSGLCRASDSDSDDAINMVFPSLYIKLTHRLKKGDIPAHLIDKVRDMLTPKMVANSKIPHRIMERSQQTAFLQCVVLTANGQRLARPAVKQALVMGTNLSRIMSNVLTKAYLEQKLDVFHPKTGHCLIIRGLPADPTVGRTIPIHTVEIGPPTAIAEASAKSYWVPWEQALARRTTQQMISDAVRCYGADVVSLVYPDDVAALQRGPASAPAPAAVPAAPPRQPESEPSAIGGVLDLSNAVSGDVDTGDAPEETVPQQPAPAVGKPVSAAQLANDYQAMLGKL